MFHFEYHRKALKNHTTKTLWHSNKTSTRAFSIYLHFQKLLNSFVSYKRQRQLFFKKILANVQDYSCFAAYSGDKPHSCYIYDPEFRHSGLVHVFIRDYLMFNHCFLSPGQTRKHCCGNIMFLINVSLFVHLGKYCCEK